MFITSKTFITGDEKRLVHLGFSEIDKVAKNNLQSFKNSVLTCVTHFIAPTINKSTRESHGEVIREFANNVFHARIYFPLRYTSLISVCDVIS